MTRHASLRARGVLAAAGALLVLLAPAPARGADPEFKLLVPVVVKNLHPYVTTLEVLCSPKDANGNWMTYDVANSYYDTPKPDATGSWSGTVTSTIKLFDPADAVKVKRYSCFLRVVYMGIHKIPEDCADPMSNWWCLKPGTPRTLTAEGAVP